jgi:membrane protease YdiL (CAAX protease family)
MSVPPPQTSPPASRGHVSEGFQWWAPFAALFAALVGALVLTSIIAGATGNLDGGDLPPGVLLAGTFIQDALLIAAMIGFARLGGARTSPRAFGVRRVRFRDAILAAVMVFVIFYAFLLAWSQLQPDATDDLAKDLGAKDSTLALVAVAILVGIVAPVVEELFFRGFLFGALGRTMHWVLAALVTGFVFGAIHAGGTPAVFLVPLAVLGALLCVLYRRTGSLLPGMGVHAFNNALALAVAMGWSFAGGLAAVVLGPAIVVVLAANAAD